VSEESAVSMSGSVPAEINIPGIPHINLPDEYKTDILDPLGLSNRGNAPSYGGSSYGGSPYDNWAYGGAGFGGQEYNMPYNNPGQPDRNDPFAMSASADVPLAEEIPETPKSKMSEDDLFSDMQAILTGAKVFDPLTKKTVSKDQLGKPASKETPPPRQQQPAADALSLPKSSEHAIFDKIAQSMQYANAYDLGSIDLENRFSGFDRISDYKDKEATEKKNQPVSKDMDQEIKAGHAEFIADLDAIRKDQQEKAGTDNADTEINTVIN